MSSSLLEILGCKRFTSFINLKEGTAGDLDPHVETPEKPLKLPSGIERLAEAFKKSKEVPLAKEVDSKAGGEKNVTMKSKKLFVVGGAVRDFLLGHTPSNFDLATDAHPDEVERICLNAKPAIQVLKKDAKGGTVRVSVEGETYDIETMRLPMGKENSTTFTTNPGEDSTRRDVTINSLYYEISSKKIYDYTGGLRHLKDGAVKFIGRPEDRIAEDGMRKYRYARMLNKVPGATADKETKDAIVKHQSDGDDLPPEKIRDEFWRGMEDLHSNAVRYLKTYQDLGLLQTVFPKLELSLDFPDCKTCKSRPIVLASLLKNNKPQKLVDTLKELKYSDGEIKNAVFLINLLLFKPEYVYEFKKQLLKSSLTKRQIMDWVKMNKLDAEIIEKLVDHKLSVNPSETSEKEGLQGDDLQNRVGGLEAKAFMKSMRS